MLRPVLRTVVGILCVANGAFAADETREIDRKGTIVELSVLFPKAMLDRPTQGNERDWINRALVANGEVFAFLETPENQKLVAGLKTPAAVHVRGKLLPRGQLVGLHSVEVLETGDDAWKKFQMETGKPIRLKGVNKCQCGLPVGDLPSSCKLGHLHHLEADDGKLYHYLRVGMGEEAFLGKGSHFKPVQVEGRVFPGQFVWIESLRRP